MLIESKTIEVGGGVIHSNQLEAGEGVCEKLFDGPTHLTAGCQSGKTGVVIYAVNKFLNGGEIDKNQHIKYYERELNNRDRLSKTQVIWINARSDNYLRNQTEKRLTEAFGTNKVLTRDSISKKKSLGYDDDDENRGKLIGRVYIGHLCDLQIDNNDNLVQLKKVIDFEEPILLVLDESHVGQDKSDRKVTVSKNGDKTEYNIGVLDNFCKNLGIYLTQPKDKWDARRYFLSMSATRPSWSVYIEEFRENFDVKYVPQIVHLHPGNHYCGIAKDYDNVTETRFVQSESFYDDKSKMVSNQIIDEVNTLPVGKCIIIRSILRESDNMINSLKRLGFKEGKSNYAYVKCGFHDKTANALNEYLTDCRIMKGYKTIFFIENFLGAGATFPNVRIHAQFERHNKSNPTAHIQSVGRSFGYSDEYKDNNGDIKVFNKKDAKYKIYCDLDIMKVYKNGFNTDTAVYNDSGLRVDKKSKGQDEYEWVCDIIPINVNESVHTTLQKHYFNKFKNDSDIEKMIRIKQNTVRISYTKSSKYLDLIDLINKQIVSDEKSKLSISNRIICIDGANAKHDKNSDNPFFEIELCNSYKELIHNIRLKKSWLCEFNVTASTFRDNYICVYVKKKSVLVKKSYKLKKDTVLII